MLLPILKFTLFVVIFFVFPFVFWNRLVTLMKKQVFIVQGFFLLASALLCCLVYASGSVFSVVFSPVLIIGLFFSLLLCLGVFLNLQFLFASSLLSFLIWEILFLMRYDQLPLVLLLSIFAFTLLLMSILGLLLINHKDHAKTLQTVSTFLFGFLLIILSIHMISAEFVTTLVNHHLSFKVVGGAFYTLIGLLSWGAFLQHRLSAFNALGFSLLAIPFLLLFFIPFSSLLFTVFSVLNFLLLMIEGILKRETWRINMSILFLFVFIIEKSIEWLFVTQNEALSFMFLGVILLSSGLLLEKGRRYLLLRLFGNQNV